MWMEIALAAATLILSWAYEANNQKNAEGRSAYENKVRSLYQAVKDRFGMSQDQLNQAAEKLDFKLSQLSDSTRGSSRLSTASKKLRDYIQQYPELKSSINAAKNTITNAINNLNSKEATQATNIQKRKDVRSKDVLDDVAPEIKQVNTVLTDVNSKLSGNNETPQINTDLSDVSELNKFKASSQARDAIEAGFRKINNFGIDPKEVAEEIVKRKTTTKKG